MNNFSLPLVQSGSVSPRRRFVQKFDNVSRYEAERKRWSEKDRGETLAAVLSYRFTRQRYICWTFRGLSFYSPVNDFQAAGELRAATKSGTATTASDVPRTSVGNVQPPIKRKRRVVKTKRYGHEGESIWKW